MKKYYLLLLLSLLFLPEVFAEVDSKGSVGFEARFFHDDESDETQDFGLGLVSRLEVDHSTKSFSNKIQVFARMDGKDRSRDRVYVEELYSKYSSGAFSALFGYQVLNWSTAEAFAPSDVINSRNFDSNFENAEKLGEPMVELSYVSDWFEARAYYLPLAMKPFFPETGNRLNPIPSSVSVNDFVFIDNDGTLFDTSKVADQYAVQLKGLFGDLELDLFYIHHFDRTDLKFVPSGLTEVIPFMTRVDQYGFSTNYVYNEFLLKSEFVYRDFEDQIPFGGIFTSGFIDQEDYGILSLAIEYVTAHTSGSETNFILEGQSLLFVGESGREGLIPFQRDLLFGLRHSLNDVAGREFFFSVIGDVEFQKELLLSLKYSQRFGETWKGQVGLRYIDAPPSLAGDISGIRSLDKDHQLDLTLIRYF